MTGVSIPSSPAMRRQSAARSQRGICATNGARRVTSSALFDWFDVCGALFDPSKCATQIEVSSSPTVTLRAVASTVSRLRRPDGNERICHGSAGPRLSSIRFTRCFTRLTTADAGDSRQGGVDARP